MFFVLAVNTFKCKCKCPSPFPGIDLEKAFSEIIDCLVSLSHLSVTLNSSCNFVIYCYKDQNFRATLLKMLGLTGNRGDCRNNSRVLRTTTAIELSSMTVQANGVVTIAKEGMMT